MTAAADWMATLRLEAWHVIYDGLTPEQRASIDDPTVLGLIGGALDVGLSVGFARGVAAAKEAQ